jgi:UTP--glucose-1-phosphate uridylyltransferase
LGPELFDILAENIEHNMRERGEFQLTSALERMRREVGFLGLVVNGEAYDIGQPARYLNTLRTFSPGVTRE